jgi:hypothetical protein
MKKLVELYQPNVVQTYIVDAIKLHQTSSLVQPPIIKTHIRKCKMMEEIMWRERMIKMKISRN